MMVLVIGLVLVGVISYFIGYGRALNKCIEMLEDREK